MSLANVIEIVKRFLSKIVDSLNRLLKLLFQGKYRRQTTPKISTSEKKEKHQVPEQINIEKSKFASSPRSMPEQQSAAGEISPTYNEDRIALQIRDPWWIHCYWEVSALTKDELKESFGEQYYQASWALRAYDVSSIIFNGFNAHRYFDISINAQSDNWHINVSSGRSFCVDLGLKLRDGRFILVLRSNTVTTPLDQPSWVIDEEWLIPDEEFLKLYGFGPNATSPMGKRIRKRIGEHISSSGFIPAAKK
ncbi:DUF4912 domain-containing protein [Candidatus Omnitrophota bacterium]